MDKKIKLTDEEIVKALECCSCDVCSNCCLYGKGGMDECTSKLAKNAFELVNRLRSENEELNKDYIELDIECRELRTELEKELNEHEEFAKKANAEIERLTEELDLANETIDRNNKRYERVSIERQKALDRVDFLEDALLDKIRRNEELITAIKQAEQQAVKDTAKELIEEIDNVKEIFPNDIVGYEQAQGWCMCIDKLKEIAKRKGVEVE